MGRHNALYQQLVQGVLALGLSLPDSAVGQMLDYLCLLERWNAVYSLTAVHDPAQMLTRHLLDSLAILPFVQGQTLADLGTGPGLPGIVLALAAPQRDITLVDSQGKKVQFLREVVRRLKLERVRVVQSRVEQLEGCFDCIATRAFASLADMLHLGGHLLAPHGRWLAMKGPAVSEELSGIPRNFVLHDIHQLSVPGLRAQRCLVVLARHDDA